MNNINVTGGLTKELEVKFFNVGNKQVVVAGFVLANTFYGGKEKKTQYIQCQMYGEKRIEALQKYLVKGCQVVINGELRVENWKDDKGQYHNRTYILVNDLEITRFVDKKADEPDYSKMKNDELKKVAKEKGIDVKGKKRDEVIEALKNYIGVPVDDSDIPF